MTMQHTINNVLFLLGALVAIACWILAFYSLFVGNFIGFIVDVTGGVILGYASVWFGDTEC